MRTQAHSIAIVVLTLGITTTAAAQIVKKCPPDAVKVGNTCVDIFEASVWQISDPTGAGKKVIKKIGQGKVKLTDLTSAGAVQLGCTTVPFNHAAYPTNFPLDGNWTPITGSSPPTPGVYAVSVGGVLPTTCTTQFRAAAACALAGKRLIRNDEWQAAAQGTPDPGASDDGSTTCATNSAAPAPTGSRTSCVSAWGVRDMIGNASELVSDWNDRASNTANWTTVTGIAGNDSSAFGGSGAGGLNAIPAAPNRGGDFNDDAAAGVFAVSAFNSPADSLLSLGFRCAR